MTTRPSVETCRRKRPHQRAPWLRLALVGAVAGVTACAVDVVDPQPDPRLGTQGKVRFVGGGCSGSTTMAVGASEVLQVEPAAQQRLPGTLAFGASNPAVIRAQAGEAPNEVRLEAVAAGDSTVVVIGDGSAYDSLTFHAEPAASVRYDAVPRVFAGGMLDVQITDVFGACGDDECPLFGHSFLRWSSEPAGRFELWRDEAGTASLRAAASVGNAEVIGVEPSAGSPLVRAPVQVVATEEVDELAASLTLLSLDPESEAPAAVELPTTVPGGAFFCVQLRALRQGGDVPLSRHDVRWTVVGDREQALMLPMNHGSEPRGTLFVVSSSAAQLTLHAEVELLGRSADFAVTVEPQ
jgi:hypothetical protein